MLCLHAACCTGITYVDIHRRRNRYETYVYRVLCRWGFRRRLSGRRACGAEQLWIILGSRASSSLPVRRLRRPASRLATTSAKPFLINIACSHTQRRRVVHDGCGSCALPVHLSHAARCTGITYVDIHRRRNRYETYVYPVLCRWGFRRRLKGKVGVHALLSSLSLFSLLAHAISYARLGASHRPR
jgi:hypothetical protein